MRQTLPSSNQWLLSPSLRMPEAQNSNVTPMLAPGGFISASDAIRVTTVLSSEFLYCSYQPSRVGEIIVEGLISGDGIYSSGDKVRPSNVYPRSYRSCYSIHDKILVFSEVPLQRSFLNFLKISTLCLHIFRDKSSLLVAILRCWVLISVSLGNDIMTSLNIRV